MSRNSGANNCHPLVSETTRSNHSAPQPAIVGLSETMSSERGHHVYRRNLADRG